MALLTFHWYLPSEDNPRFRNEDILRSGVFRMLAPSNGADDVPDQWSVGHAATLLEKALEIIDRWDDCPEIGARLQQVIEDVRERQASS